MEKGLNLPLLNNDNDDDDDDDDDNNNNNNNKTATLGTSHIIRKVLQCETWSLSGGDHRWLKRSRKAEKACDKKRR